MILLCGCVKIAGQDQQKIFKKRKIEMEYVVNDNLKVRIYITRRTAKNGKPFHEYLICGDPDPLLLRSRSESDDQFYQDVKVFDFDCKLEHDGLYDVNLQRFQKDKFFGWQFVGMPVYLETDEKSKVGKKLVFKAEKRSISEGDLPF